MKRGVIVLAVIFLLAIPAHGMEFAAPEAPEEALEYLPEDTENFGKGLWHIIRSGIAAVKPEIAEASGVCICLIAASLMTGVLIEIAGNVKPMVELTACTITAIILFQPMNSLINLGAETVREVSQYGELLLPVMTGAMAAQGGVAKSGALYATTAAFNAVLSGAISSLLIPLVYIFLTLAIAGNLFPQTLLKEILKFLKWMITWLLKTILYVFTGYISITGVVGGATDATVLKATKLTISGMVPLVGNILSDASEAVLVSAGLMKNAAGIYGLLTVTAIWIGPFLKIGIQYLILKIAAGICGIFGTKRMSELINDFSGAMGLMLAMTGAVSMIFVISTICFMKGVN